MKKKYNNLVPGSFCSVRRVIYGLCGNFYGFVFLLYLDDAFAFETLLLWMGGIVCFMFEFGGMFCL